MENGIHSALARAVKTLLTPLVRVLLRNGISCGAVVEWLKTVFVDVAEREFREPGKQQTVSRISALTGLTRKEVKRLRELPERSDGETGARYSRATRVISGWLNDPQYLQADQPMVLPMEGDAPSFAALVKSHSGDIPTQAMFRVLADAATIDRRDDGVHLLSHAYIPAQDPVEMINILGADVGELIATIDHNLTAAEADLRFQRKVSSARLDSNMNTAFKALSADKAQALLEELDEWLTEHEVDAQDAAHPPVYVSMGICYFENVDIEGNSDE